MSASGDKGKKRISSYLDSGETKQCGRLNILDDLDKVLHDRTSVIFAREDWRQG